MCRSKKAAALAAGFLYRPAWSCDQARSAIIFIPQKQDGVCDNWLQNRNRPRWYEGGASRRMKLHQSARAEFGVDAEQSQHEQNDAEDLRLVQREGRDQQFDDIRQQRGDHAPEDARFQDNHFVSPFERFQRHAR